MSRIHYNWIMKMQLDTRRDPENSRKISNFTGRIRGMHIFVGNFTYITDFLIVEDIGSTIDPCLSHVELGKPFVKVSNMTYYPSIGIVKYTDGMDEVAYQMPHKIEQFRPLLNIEKEHKQSVYFRNDEDKRRGVDYNDEMRSLEHLDVRLRRLEKRKERKECLQEVRNTKAKKGFMIKSFKSSTQHPIVDDFVIINIPEEDVEPKQIILDLDDQPMWESAKTVAPIPNSAIIQLDVDDNFVINSTHLNMIRENKFDGYLRADPHDHICEILAIYNMFKYGETQSEAVKLLIFHFSLCDKAKTWLNELNKESITSWEQMRKAFINKFFPPSLYNRLLFEIRSFSQNVCESLTDTWLRLKNMLRKCHGHCLTKGTIIQIFYHGLDEPTQGIFDETAGGIFLYKIPNQAFQLLEDKSLKEEMHEMRKNYNNCGGDHASKNDDTPMCERHEANYIQSEGYENRNSYDSHSHQSHHDR
ncbi:reverse transcriptase domain-containing protein [Tanacetum coccineum]